MSIPLSIQVYERGAAGVPSTTIKIGDLAGLITSYQHTISDHFGFESMQVSFPCDIATGMDWLQNGLMRSVVVYGPDAETVWEGYLETVALTVGQKKASVSLKDMGNRVTIKYNYNGAPAQTAAGSNTTSQALYGVKDQLAAIGEVPATGITTNLRTRILNAAAFPRSSETTEAKTSALGEITLELTFAGWYNTMDWLFVPFMYNSGSVTTVQGQIAVLLTTAAATNAFVSTDSSQLAAMGYSINDQFPPEHTYRNVIDMYLGWGDNSNNTMAWGVYENRVLQSAVWAGATPTTITYQEDAGTGVVFDAYGNEVKPWNVRPNAMSQVVQLLDVGPAAGAVDAAARKYVARVTCSISGDTIGCTLEPSGGSALDAVLGAFVSRTV